MGKVEYIPIYVMRDTERHITGVLLPIEGISLIGKITSLKTNSRHSKQTPLARLERYDPRWEGIKMH